MEQKKVKCPSCSGIVTATSRFAHMAICPYCHSAVIVDQAVVSVAGKMAVLPVSDSPLYLGAEGSIQGVRSQILGRLRYGYSAGYWDEWYIRHGEEYAWISESEGELILEKVSNLDLGGVDLSDYTPGDNLELGDTVYSIKEKGTATCEGGEGELPFLVRNGEVTEFFDLVSGDNYATLELDADRETRVFTGTRLKPGEVMLDWSKEEMGRQGDSMEVERAASATGRQRITHRDDRAKSITCPHCGGTMDFPAGGESLLQCLFCQKSINLAAIEIVCPECGSQVQVEDPDKAKSTTCPKCKSRLDLRSQLPKVLKGNLPRNLGSAKPKGKSIFIKPGQSFVLRGRKYDVLGHLRYIEGEGRSVYSTDEFYLRMDSGENRWLSVSDGHFTLSKAMPSSPVGDSPKKLSVRHEFSYDGRNYKVFEKSNAMIDWVNGELPWVAQAGDYISYLDAESTPYMISAEWNNSEMEWFIGEYIPRGEIAKAFGISNELLPMVWGIAGNQPYPESKFRQQYLWVMVLFFVINSLLALWLRGQAKKVSSFTAPPSDYAKVYTSPAFEVKEPGTCKLSLHSSVYRSWVYLTMTLIDSTGKEHHKFSSQLFDSGGKKKRPSDSVLFKIAKAGNYHFLVSGEGGSEGKTNPAACKNVSFTMYRNVRPVRYVAVLALFCLAVAVLETMLRIQFKKNKWEDD